VANGGLVHQISDERGAAPSRISVLGDYSDVLADITIKQTVLESKFRIECLSCAVIAMSKGKRLDLGSAFLAEGSIVDERAHILSPFGDIVNFVEALVTVTVIVIQVRLVSEFDKLEVNAAAFDTTLPGIAFESIKDGLKFGGGESEVLGAEVETPGHFGPRGHELGEGIVARADGDVCSFRIRKRAGGRNVGLRDDLDFLIKVSPILRVRSNTDIRPASSAVPEVLESTMEEVVTLIVVGSLRSPLGPAIALQREGDEEGGHVHGVFRAIIVYIWGDSVAGVGSGRSRGTMDKGRGEAKKSDC